MHGLTGRFSAPFGSNRGIALSDDPAGAAR
jgi:hypothetical protein